MTTKTIPCFCGKSTKKFLTNIKASSYMEECCQQAGYDIKGNLPPKPLRPVPTVDPSLPSDSLPTPPEQDCGSRERQLNDNVRPPLRAGRGRLMDTNRGELDAIATALGIADVQNMNKRVLVEAILDKRANGPGV